MSSRAIPEAPDHRTPTERERWALLPALQPWLERTRSGDMLRSPWVYQVPFFDAQYANERYETMKALIDDAVACGDFARALTLVEKPYRIPMLASWDLLDGMPLDALRAGLLFAWASNEFIHQHRTAGLRLLRRTGFITDVVPEVGDTGTEAPFSTVRPPVLDGVLTVYRGVRARTHRGSSWSLDYETALFFARRFPGRSPVVLTGTVPAHKVLAYLEARDERTVIVHPRSVTITGETAVEAVPEWHLTHAWLTDEEREG